MKDLFKRFESDYPLFNQYKFKKLWLYGEFAAGLFAGYTFISTYLSVSDVNAATSKDIIDIGLSAGVLCFLYYTYTSRILKDNAVDAVIAKYDKLEAKVKKNTKRSKANAERSIANEKRSLENSDKLS